MARYTGPKNKIARREGLDFGYKTPGSNAHASLLKRLNVPPGQHGPKRRSKLSSFGQQLREKQKMRRKYGVLERQFRKYYAKAMKDRGNTGEALLQELERRLDNIVYRLSLAPTRDSARQMVNHGHVLVDNKKVSIPSFQVSEGMVISLKPKALEIPAVKKILEDKNPTIAGWLLRKGSVGNIVKIPTMDDLSGDINIQLVVEYYSSR